MDKLTENQKQELKSVLLAYKQDRTIGEPNFQQLFHDLTFRGWIDDIVWQTQLTIEILTLFNDSNCQFKQFLSDRMQTSGNVLLGRLGTFFTYLQNREMELFLDLSRVEQEDVDNEDYICFMEKYSLLTSEQIKEKLKNN